MTIPPLLVFASILGAMLLIGGLIHAVYRLTERFDAMTRLMMSMHERITDNDKQCSEVDAILSKSIDSIKAALRDRGIYTE